MLWLHPVAPIIQQENLKQDQENHRQMRGYQTGIGGVALTLREHEHEQKQLPHRADLNDAEQAGREDEPLKHNDQAWELEYRLYQYERTSSCAIIYGVFYEAFMFCINWTKFVLFLPSVGSYHIWHKLFSMLSVLVRFSCKV